MDVEAAFDSVLHDDILTTYKAAGASSHQLMAMARAISNINVTLDVNNVASYGPIPFTKALRTGGKTDPDKFVRMFETLVETCLYEWDLLGYGFHFAGG